MSLILIAALLGADPAVSHVRTEHYDVRSTRMPAEEVGRMLDQLHTDLTRFFGRAPDELMELELYENHQQYKEAIIADRQPFVGGGGYYAPSRRKAYVWHQPSEYFTRHLILHEATHQFHFLVANKGEKIPGAGWYIEGLAEYFGMHNWDGKTLKTGVVPEITLEDYPAAALAELDRCQGDLEAIAAGSKGNGRPVYWALVHFMMKNYPRQFGALSLKLDRGEDPLGAWKSVFGEATDELKKEFRGHVVRNAQPWRDVWRAWQQRGDAIEGRSGVTGLAVLKEVPELLEAEMELIGGNLRAGLTFNYMSPQEFSMVQVFSNRTAWLIDRVGGQWQNVRKIPVAPPDGRNVVAACHKDGKFIFSVNGKEIHSAESAGLLGLNVDSCHVHFRVKQKSGSAGERSIQDKRQPPAGPVPPWYPVWTHWWQTGKVLEGKSQVTGVAIFKQTPKILETQMELVEGNLRAGLTFGYKSPKNFQMIQIINNRAAWLIERADDQWKAVRPRTIPLPEAERHVLSLRKKEDKVTLSVNGREVETLEAAGQVGLNVDSCHVRFRFWPQPEGDKEQQKDPAKKPQKDDEPDKKPKTDPHKTRDYFQY